VTAFCFWWDASSPSRWTHRPRIKDFVWKKPDAQSVGLAGEFNNWKAQAMTKGNDGVWTITASLSPGTYGYKFFVNGTDWTFDPKNPNRKTVDGIENSAIEISDGGSGSGLPTPQSTATPSATPVPTPESSVRGNTAALAPTPGEILTLDVSLSHKRRAEAAQDGNARLAHAKMAMAVPQNFDPPKPWSVLIISNTEAYSNIDSMRQFKQAAIDEGWVIIAADAGEAEKNKEGSALEVKNSLKALDFKKCGWKVLTVHTISTNIGEALRWFIAQSSTTSPGKRESDFDKFFKKKP
jgi:hypothetical protein